LILSKTVPKEADAAAIGNYLVEMPNECRLKPLTASALKPLPLPRAARLEGGGGVSGGPCPQDPMLETAFLAYKSIAVSAK